VENMIVKSSNELFEHYQEIKNISKTELLSDFEIRVLKSSMLSLGQIYNPLHYSNFSLNIREMLNKFVDRISNKQMIKQAWWYERPEKAISEITTNQKYKYSILGNTPIEFHELLAELEIDVDNEIDKLTKQQKQLNKYTHFNEKSLDFTWNEAKKSSLRLLQEFLSYLLLVKQINQSLQEHIAESIRNEVEVFFVNNYVEKLDEIATHYYSPNPSIDSITCEFDDEYLYIEILGNVEVDFQIGSNSDIKRGDGHEFSHSFSFTGNLISKLDNIEDIEVEDDNWLDIDTDGYFD